MRRAAGLIALAFVAAHAAVFLAGRTLLPIAPSMTTVPGAPYGYSGPVSDATTSVDPAGALNVSYSNDRFTAEALSRGRMPFWNSRQGFGSPFLSSGHPAVLYPLTPLLTIVPPDEYDFLYLFNWYLAALFTYLFLRTIEVGDSGAIIGGVAVATSGFFQYYIAFREASTTAAWFPALLYAVERTLREPGWRWRHVAITVACYGTITAGQPESTALALSAATLYGLVSVAASPRRAAALRAFLPGAVCGALLTAPHWWNFSDYAFTAFSGHDPGSTGAQASLGWRTAAAYITPQLYGRLHTLPPHMIPPGWSWDLSPGWIPAAVSLGALFGMWRAAASRSRPLILLVAIAVFVAGRMWGLPPFTLISRLPLFDRIVYPRYGAFVLAFVAAILAGAGWEFALSKTPRQWLRVGAAWIAIAAVLYLLTGVWRLPVFAATQVRAFSALAWMWTVAVPAALWWLRRRDAIDATVILIVAGAAMVLQFVAYGPGYAPETYAVLTVCCLGVWLLLTLFTSAAPRRRAATVLILAACICGAPELVLALSDSRGLPRRYDAATAPPYAATLRALEASTGGRAYAIDGIPQPNFSSPLGFETLDKCDPLQSRGAALFVKRRLDRGADPVCLAGKTRREPSVAIDEFRNNRRFFNLGAVRYLVTQTTPARALGVRLAGWDGSAGVQIWENPDALPRAFVACPAARVETLDAALDTLPQLEHLDREIVVEPGVIDPCPHDGRTPSGTLETFAAEGNEITLRYHNETPAMLVIVDAYEAGWTARVDGESQPVVRADGAFIGVPLMRGGEHTIALSYRPPHWRASLAAAGAGAAALAGFTLLPFQRRERLEHTFA